MASTKLFLAICVVGAVIDSYFACPTGWESSTSGGSCYKFVESAKSWQAARDYCATQLGSDLAVIDTVNEAADVQAIRTRAGKSNNYYWIGAQQQADAHGPFIWVKTGAIFNAALWFPGEPNQVDNIHRQCVDLGTPSQQRKMNDYPCSASLSSLCELACPAGWVVSSNGRTCYKFVETHKSWQTARNSCKNMGGDLAIIDTEAEADAVKAFRLRTGRSNNYYWIGAQQRIDAYGPFIWVKTGAIFNQALWFPGEPNQVDNVHRQCVDLGTPGQQMKMNDYPCSASLAYMCEKGI